MLPLTLLKVAEDQPMLIELKNGDTYNGRLVSCNAFMNICLKDVICTSKNGDKFWKMPECYIRGNTIKYLRIPDEIIHQVAADEQEQRRSAMRANAPRGVQGGRTSGGRFGRGDGSGRGAGRGGEDSGAAGGAPGAGRGAGRGGGRGGGRGDGYRGGGRGSGEGYRGGNGGGRGEGQRGGGGRGGGRDGGGRFSRPQST